MFISWNAYFSFTSNFIIKWVKTSPKKLEKETDDRKTIRVSLPYLKNVGNNMKKKCFKKCKKCIKENVCFITCFEKKKTAMFAQLRIALQYIYQIKVTFFL